MQEIKYTNSKGNSRLFQYHDDFHILDDYKEAQYINNWTTKGYNQHGATYIKSLMGEREITLSFWIIGRTIEDFYAQREEIFHLFNPVLGLGTLEYHNGVVDRMMDVYIANMPEELENYGNGRLYEVKLRAPHPFLYDKELNGIQFADSAGGFTFAAVFAPTKIFGYDMHAAIATNDGDIPAPVKLTIKNAQMVNPRIVMEDGSFIGLQKEISADEEIVIDTSYGNKSITINGKAADAYLMPGSTWIQLPIGETRVRCETDEGSPNVYMTWHNYYLGA
ncbi:MAG: phage tail family protein [Paludibacteraceae bacterium]|nr:phage tail family protein [Paludibacteraceae bacterium]